MQRTMLRIQNRRIQEFENLFEKPLTYRMIEESSMNYHTLIDKNPTKFLLKLQEFIPSTLEIQSFINGGFWRDFVFNIEGFNLMGELGFRVTS